MATDCNNPVLNKTIRHIFLEKTLRAFRAWEALYGILCDIDTDDMSPSARNAREELESAIRAVWRFKQGIQ